MTASNVGIEPRGASNWIMCGDLNLVSGIFAVGDPNLFPSAETISAPKGRYSVWSKCTFNNELEPIEVRAVRILEAHTAQSGDELENLHLGESIAEASCDFSQIGVSDFVRCVKACECLHSERQQQIIEALDSCSLICKIDWAGDERAIMFVFKVIGGDGTFPISRVMQGARMVGIHLQISTD